jgi:putative ABC transport system permease protein
MGGVTLVFALLALTIAGLGVVGLVAFTAAQKTKEIGIRKVMGATPGSIVALISGEFSRLVLVAIFLGIPASYFVMKAWLTNFAYRAPLTLTPFLWAALLCAAIAYVAAASQAVRASLTDPSRTLRME